jgi:hypothetical protein
VFCVVVVVVVVVVVRPAVAAITIIPVSTSVTIAFKMFQNTAVRAAAIITHWFGLGVYCMCGQRKAEEKTDFSFTVIFPIFFFILSLYLDDSCFPLVPCDCKRGGPKSRTCEYCSCCMLHQACSVM